MDTGTPLGECRAIELTRMLVRHNSTNPPGNEAPIIREVDALLRRAGLETEVVPYRTTEPNEPEGSRAQLVARLRGNGTRPGLLFSGHVDVVPPGGIPWSLPPFGAEVRDGRLYGRGSCDMKGGVAALLAAAERLAASGTPLQGDLVVAITADEERNCLGAEELARPALRSLLEGVGAALVAEPTSLNLFVAEKGAMWVRVTMLGRTAHASMPEAGANAIAALAEFLTRWEREFPRDVEHPLLGRATLSVGRVEGGVKVNVVPDRAVAELDMRTVPGVEHGDLVRRAEGLAARVAQERPGIRGEVEVVADRASVSSPPDSPLALALVDAARNVRGTAPSIGGVPYCTEACIWVPELGIPAVICGPGSPSMAHQPDEYVELTELEAAEEIFLGAATRLLA
jgi:succinyl-diaminopimelate desuccinylase